MLTVMRGAVLAALSFTLLACAEQSTAPGAPLFSCERHIYNKSSCPWSFQQSPSDVHQVGNMYFGNGTLPNCTQLNGPCIIQPGATVTLEYTYTAGRTAGTMLIIDRRGAKDGSKSFGYRTNNYNECPYVVHSGGTGGVSVNEPADGDYTIDKCEW